MKYVAVILFVTLALPPAAFSETIREKLTSRMSAFGKTKFNSGHLLETEATFFDDGTGKINFFTDDGNILCLNDYAIVSENDSRLEIRITPTERSDDFCPGEGTVILASEASLGPLVELYYGPQLGNWIANGILYYVDPLQPYESFPYGELSLKYSRLNKDNFQEVTEALALMVSESEAVGASVSPNACDNAVWNGVVTNVADLFLCDEGRAMGLLASGAVVRFPIQEVRLEDGWLFLETFTAGSFMDSELEAVRDGEVDSMEQFLNATSSYEMNWRIVCFRKPSAQNSYGVGDIFEGRGKITQYEAKTVVLDCR